MTHITPDSAVQLALEVRRSSDGRLTGNVLRGESGIYYFNGTLELLRLLEDLVPGFPSDPQR